MNEDMEKMLQEAPAPTLTLEPFAEEKEEPAVVEKEEAVQPVDEKEKIKAILTPQEQKQVDAFVKQIDIPQPKLRTACTAFKLLPPVDTKSSMITTLEPGFNSPSIRFSNP